jgi:Predicted membrane protein
MSNSGEHKVQIVVADPSAVGLLGLAVVTAVAASQKLGITTGLSFVIPWAIFLGAVAQLIASVYDFNHNNLFGATVFGAFGLFWLGVASSWMIKMGAFGPELAADVDGRQIGYAFLVFFVFAVVATIAATETNKTLFFDMIFIDVLLLGLALDALGIGGHWAHDMAAYAEVIVSVISLYACCATFLNKFFGRSFWPLGAPLGIFKKG